MRGGSRQPLIVRSLRSFLLAFSPTSTARPTLPQLLLIFLGFLLPQAFAIYIYFFRHKIPEFISRVRTEMESDSWAARFSSKRHQPTLQSRSDMYLAFEEMDGDDDARTEFACPFCAEDFDIVGLCCHIDEEHPVEAKNGVCPVCAARVGMDMVGHITMQHGQFFKMQRRRRFRRGLSGSHSTLSQLRKELREGHLQSLLGSSSCVSSTNAAPDPLSLLIYNLPLSDTVKDVEASSVDEGSSTKKSADVKVIDSSERPLSDKELKEKARKRDFVQELLLSTFLDDTL